MTSERFDIDDFYAFLESNHEKLAAASWHFWIENEVRGAVFVMLDDEAVNDDGLHEMDVTYVAIDQLPGWDLLEETKAFVLGKLSAYDPKHDVVVMLMAKSADSEIFATSMRYEGESVEAAYNKHFDSDDGPIRGVLDACHR